MRSKISFYNKGLARNLLRRFWPLGAGYLLVLLLVLLCVEPGKFASRDLLEAGIACGTLLSFFAAGLAALCMFQFLYSSRGSGLICSLPLRRETVFSTAYLTGLLLLLGADLAAALLAAPVLPLRGIDPAYLLPWLALLVLGNLSFYGTAVFCAMLTGSLVILPVVYTVLHFAAFVVENCVANLMELFVYGFCRGDWKLLWLSPVIYLFEKLEVQVELDSMNNLVRAWVSGWGALAAACAAGLALSALALLLFRRREMERASDTVAFPVLKPLFRVCLSIGTGLVLAAAVMEWRYRWYESGWDPVLPIAGLLVLGAVVGWFAAEMLLQKTVKVFKSGWKGCLAVCLALAAGTAALELDLFGFEDRVPAPEQVESVEFNRFSDFTFSEPENVEAVTSLHRQIISEKAQTEAGGEQHSNVVLTYMLKNGKILQRRYYLSYDPEELEDDGSAPMRIQALFNTPEALERRRRLGEEIPLTESSLVYVRLERDNEYGEEERYNIPQDQALAFVENCVLPDMEEGTLDRDWYVVPESYYALCTEWRIRVCQEQTLPGEDRDLREYSYSLQMDSARCIAWLREHTDLKIRPLEQITDERDLTWDFYGTHYYMK